VVFLLAGRDDLQRPVGKRTLQCLGLIPRSAQPGVLFLGRREDHRHRFRVDAPDLGRESWESTSVCCHVFSFMAFSLRIAEPPNGCET
jgi:hypothetical protein